MQLINLSNSTTFIRLEGEKSATFLQGQVTCDVREISEHLTRLSAHCNPKGRVLSSFRVLHYENNLYLLAPSDMETTIIQQLTPYAQFSRVTLVPENKLSIVGCFGENTDAFLKTIFQTLPSQPDEAVYENNLLLIRLPSERFYIIGDKEQLSSITEIYQNALTTDAQTWQLLEIQSGIATIHPETSNLFTPHMLNYPELNAVSFKKGCYVGQEIVARTQYLGKTKRVLQHLTLPVNTELKAGEKLHDNEGKEIGTIVNVVLDTETNCNEILLV